jgi:anaerobic ribonucleoside-triphosphate reductase
LRSKQDVEKELEDAMVELQNVKGGPTEIYTRICGYYRSTKNFNIGKVEEYEGRKEFTLPSSCACNETVV